MGKAAPDNREIKNIVAPMEILELECRLYFGKKINININSEKLVIPAKIDEMDCYLVINVNLYKIDKKY